MKTAPTITSFFGVMKKLEAWPIKLARAVAKQTPAPKSRKKRNTSSSSRF